IAQAAQEFVRVFEVVGTRLVKWKRKLVAVWKRLQDARLFCWSFGELVAGDRDSPGDQLIVERLEEGGRDGRRRCHEGPGAGYRGGGGRQEVEARCEVGDQWDGRARKDWTAAEGRGRIADRQNQDVH